MPTAHGRRRAETPASSKHRVLSGLARVTLAGALVASMGGVLVAQSLVFDAVNQGEALAAVNRVGGHLDELLRVPLEIGQPGAFDQDAGNRLASQLGPILQFGQHVGQLNIGLI